MIRRFGIGILAVALLAGCSGSGSDDATSPTASSSETATVVAPPQAGSDGWQEAKADGTDFSCEAKDGKWVASLKVTNPEASDQTYSVAIAAKDQAGTQLGESRWTGTVPGSGNYEIKDQTFGQSAPADTSCDYTVLRKPAG